jgi:hypothetical protein
MQIDSSVLNQLFSQKLDTPEGKSKIAQLEGVYIKDRLREVSFLRQIVPPQDITRAECQRSVNHDTLTKIIDIEPESRAMAMDFRGQPNVRIIDAPRAECAFFTISSERFEKPEQELLAYEMPITKIIEDNSVKDIEEIEDREFLLYVEAAVQVLQAEANSVSAAPILNAEALQGATPPVEAAVRKGELARNADTNNAVALPLQKPDIIELCKMMSVNRLRATVILIPEVEFDDLNMWTMEDIGGDLAKETTVDGYKYTNLVGRRYVRTIKSDILRPGNIYAFTDPDFLGKFYILNQPKFYIDKSFNIITWQSWEDIGMIVANIASIRKLELYSGDGTLHNHDSILSSVIPKDEEDLGAVNNRVDKGYVFPQVKHY